MIFFVLYFKLNIVINMIEEKIMETMETISYGVPNKENQNLFKLIDEDIVFNDYYKLQTPEELLKSKLEYVGTK